ncbi:DNA-binding transcriptional regulator, LysR family [Marinococcus luteus]|uniref:DNA-binding transcriptional regulator, LysR family n=1 Tax=Marinococcus luteus TaxID=1122204 RepID=A0A1H2TIF6_9BACI|nr:LysR family transcriptional regulator [Marinococcus luteus]SDW43786.1 DNA-binding transcriptional regulator, LysR family [Marinococcus luteus]
MDYRQLVYFMEAARLESITRAAEHLYVTQPTISKMLRQLEEEWGVTLFDRSRKKLTLTDAGAVMLEQAKKIRHSYHGLEHELDALRGLKRGQLRIGLPPILSSSFFTQVIAPFHEKYPEITLHLEENGSKKIEEALLHGDLDVGAVVLPTEESLFHTHPFVDEPLQVVLPARHELAGQPSVSLAELSRERFLLFNQDFSLRQQIITACRDIGFMPNILSESSQWDFIEKMVASGLGITLLPESICRELGGEVVIRPLAGEALRWKLGLIWHREHYLSFIAKEWLDFSIPVLSQMKQDN